MKLWGGRFAKTTDKLAEDFHSSISFDQRLYRDDILGSIAHAQMLGRVGIITEAEAGSMVKGLKELLQEIELGEVVFDVAAEDIHMNVEALLTAKLGTLAKKLHTARSRNDQVALDLRMFMRREIALIQEQIIKLIETLLNLSKQHINTIMPGYTHLQKAQPITLAHHLLAYVQMFSRDYERLDDNLKRLNFSPLGCGALAGVTYNIDREDTAYALGFDGICENSLDGVADRDFALEYLAYASIIMMHLSRLCEEIILWSSNEFAFIRLDDAYSTGSSIMPQKKNPDMAELIRGKTGRVYGDLITLLTVMKGLPLAYNKDMQEDKEAIFDSLDTVHKCLMVMTPMLATMQVNKENMLKGAAGGFINATDMADYLVKKGLAFRDAHEVVGKVVLAAEKESKALAEFSLSELKHFSSTFDDDVFAAIDLDECVSIRQSQGGPAPQAVEAAILSAENRLQEFKSE